MSRSIRSALSTAAIRATAVIAVAIGLATDSRAAESSPASTRTETNARAAQIDDQVDRMLEQRIQLESDHILPRTLPPMPRIGPDRPLALKDALAVTLEKNPAIKLQQESVRQSQGELREAAGPFDPQIQANVQTVFADGTDSTSAANPYLSQVGGNPFVQGDTSGFSDNTLNVQASVPKMFRNGITVAPVFSMASQLEGGSSDLTDTSSGFLGFIVNVPLLRGLGPNSSAAATERAAEINVTISRHTLEFAISTQLFETISAYWELLLAQDSVRVALDNQKNGRQLVQLTEALIKGYIVSAIQLDQAKANLEQFTAERIAAEQSQSAASQQLAVAMGLSVEELLKEPLAIDRFPLPPKTLNLSAETIRAFVDLALERRTDLKAAKLATQANTTLLAGARNAALPQIDMVFGGGGQQGNYSQSAAAAPTTANEAGFAVGGGVSVAWPVFNDAARGEVIQQEAVLNQSETDVYQLSIQIASDVITSSKAVINASRALKEAREATVNQRKAVWAQQQLFSMGMTSLVEVITTQTDLSTIELQFLEAMMTYATAVAHLRYATGTLLPDPEHNIYELDIARLSALPLAAELVHADETAD